MHTHIDFVQRQESKKRKAPLEYGVLDVYKRQVYLSCAYAKQHVKLVGSDPGITAALNGGTHMAFEDLGIMRTIPEMTILEPTDIEMIRDLIPKIAAYPGVVYLRLVRRTCPQVYRPGSSFVIGRANVLRPGRDVTLIAMRCV